MESLCRNRVGCLLDQWKTLVFSKIQIKMEIQLLCSRAVWVTIKWVVFQNGSPIITDNRRSSDICKIAAHHYIWLINKPILKCKHKWYNGITQEKPTSKLRGWLLARANFLASTDYAIQINDEYRAYFLTTDPKSTSLILFCRFKESYIFPSTSEKS